MFDFLKWMPIHKRLLYNKATLKCKALHGQTPEYITTDPENLVSEGPDNVVLKVTNVFHRVTYGPPSRSNWPQGVQMFLEGVPYHTRISKGNL